MTNFRQYMDNLHRLSRAIRMWPHQDHINTIASKWEISRSLDHIAQVRTNTARPTTRLLVDGERIVDAMVLKRTHSDGGEHVVLPRDVNKRNWEYLRSQLDVPCALWMAQSFVEPLVRLGEWRVFLVGGKIVYMVHTLKNRDRNTWSWDIVNTFYTLEELR
jgi:glutathione synthase/RimK-type ligase-like ATP-grasp enzyme